MLLRLFDSAKIEKHVRLSLLARLIGLVEALRKKGETMEPITLATITAAATVLATEAGKGLAGDAGKSAWEAIKKKFGWGAEPETSTLAPTIARELQERPEVAKEVLELLQASRTGTAQQLVGTLQAEKVVVANVIHGGVQM